MLNAESFRQYAHQMVEWMANYLEEVEKYPVQSQQEPGELLAKLPLNGPDESESMEQILADVEELIMPGITHWQSPHFYGYFPANSSYPSILGEMMMSAMGVNGMSWITSPAATELEERMMDWLGEWIGIPSSWSGVIQSTASEATYFALLTAREKASGYQINEKGFSGEEKYRVYGSKQLHSSIEKAVKISGIGRENFVAVAVDEHFAIKPDALRSAIEDDKAKGLSPLCIVAGLGTTSSTAVDELQALGEIAQEFGLWLHVDAAYAGSALILPEYQHWMKGIEMADSFIFNPHKWLLTNFDCSAYYVKDQEALVKTFQMSPEYLKSGNDQKVKNFRDWGMPLGRRFRALKLWFVLRNHGLKNLQAVLRNHMRLTQDLLARMQAAGNFEILAPVNLNLICFRYNPGDLSEEALNSLNKELLAGINATGKAFLIHTKLNGKYTIRIVIGNPNNQMEHVDSLWELIQEQTNALSMGPS